MAKSSPSNGKTLKLKKGATDLGRPIAPEPDPYEFRHEGETRSFPQTEEEMGISIPASKLSGFEPPGDTVERMRKKGRKLKLSSGGTSILGPKAAPEIEERKAKKRKAG